MYLEIASNGCCAERLNPRNILSGRISIIAICADLKKHKEDMFMTIGFWVSWT